MKKGIFLFFASFYLFFGPGHFNATDHVGVYMTVRNIVEFHSLGQESYSTRDGYLPIYFQGKNGRWYGKYGIGQSILSIPFYILGKYGEQNLPSGWRDFFAGYDRYYFGGTVSIFAVSTFCQFITALIMVVFYALCRRFGVKTERALTITFVLGLSTLFWSASRDYFQHPLETLLLLSSVYMLIGRRKPALRHFALSGLFMGYAIISRPVHIINLAPLLIYVYWLSRPTKSEGKIRHASLAAFFIPVCLGIAVQLAVNYTRFGGIFHFGGYDSQANRFSPENIPAGLYIYFLSLGHGLFIFAPPVIIGLLNFGRFMKQYKAEALLFAGIITVNLLFYASMPNKHLTQYGVYGLWCYGPRYVLLVIPLMLFPAVFYRPNTRTGGWGIWLTSFVGILTQLPGVLVSYAFTLNEVRDEFALLGSKANEIENITLYHPQFCLLWRNTKCFFEGRFVDLWWLYGHVVSGPAPLLASLTALFFVMSIGIGLMFLALRKKKKGSDVTGASLNESASDSISN